jgi:thiol-disulfide isomerase/thioredoxin
MKKAVAVAIIFVLAGCNRGPARSTTPTPTVKGPAPEFDLENIRGGRTKAAELKGKVLVVDFWATWCEPCISEIPKFNKMADEYHGKDVEIVGITVESPHDTIKPKVQELAMKYTVLVGNDAVVDGFGGLIGFPTTYIVTKDWKIYKKYMGALPEKDARIRKDIDKLLLEEANNLD